MLGVSFRQVPSQVSELGMQAIGLGIPRKDVQIVLAEGRNPEAQKEILEHWVRDIPVAA